MSDEAKRMRKNYFINKRFQLKYTLAISLMMLAVVIVSGVGLYLGMWGSIIENFSKFKVSQNLENVRRITDYEDARYRKGDYRLEKIFREAELLSQKEQETLAEALKSVNRSLAPKAIILIILIFIGGIFVSHRIAGPMYRIERSAQAIKDGDLRVNFFVRKGDEMKKATSVLEGMVETLRADITKIKSEVVNLEDKISALGSRISKEDAEKIRVTIKTIDSLLAKYKT